MANLTLMALGSSAPEIMLSCIETIMTLESEVKGELGPSTIVGSAAFNLLIISAVSIVSVDEPKKIDDLGVFTVTAIMSIFAYVWLVVVLKVWGPEGEVTVLESCLTLTFCILLIAAAYIADRYRRKQKEADRQEQDADELEKEKERMIAKAALRRIAQSHGQSYVIEVITGGPNALKAS